MRIGEIGDSFYLIESGELEVIRIMDDGSERVIGFRRSGDFVGEGSLFDRQGRRSASVRARTDVRLMEMKLAELDERLKSEPWLAYEIIKVVSRRLREADNTTIHDLQTKNRELTRAYAELKAAQAKIIEKERLERELQVAREIQESILPRHLPEMDYGSVGAHMQPAKAVGGDFYDVMVLDDNRLGLVVGDVSDKGMHAAIFMAMVRSLFRAEAGRSPLPATVLQAVNEHLMGMNDSSMFVTMLYGVFDRDTRRFSYARAGHDIPLCYNGRHLPVEIPRGSGMIMGLFPEPDMDIGTLQLDEGSTLLLFTDGATDMTSPAGELFGRERLTQALEASLGFPAQTVCDRVLDCVRQFQGQAEQADDITLLSLVVN